MAVTLPDLSRRQTLPAQKKSRADAQLNLEQIFRPESSDYNEFLLIFDKSCPESKVWYLVMDDTTQRPKPLPKTNVTLMPKLKDVYGYRVLVLDNILYVIGGKHLQSGAYLGHCFRYDPRTHSWARRTSMNKPRTRFTAVVLDNCFYVCGGEGRSGRILDSLECYDPKADIWVEMKPMPRPRADHAACVSEGRMFVSGGVGRQGSALVKKGGTNVFWQYDPYSDRWSPAVGESLLPYPLEHHSMVAYRGRIYCFGGIAYKRFGADTKYTEGENDCMISFSTDRGTLDMRIEGQWDRSYPKMLTPRASAGTIMLGHNIFTIGGRSVSSKESKAVIEYYNTRKRRWYRMFDLPGDLGSYSNVDIVSLRIPNRNKEFSALGKVLHEKWVLW